jgi:hypothetical protein
VAEVEEEGKQQGNGGSRHVFVFAGFPPHFLILDFPELLREQRLHPHRVGLLLLPHQQSSTSILHFLQLVRVEDQLARSHRFAR